MRMGWGSVQREASGDGAVVRAASNQGELLP